MEIKERAMTDLRESVARAVYDATNTDRDWTMAPLLFSVADHILRAIADAGPSEKMVEAAARVMRPQLWAENTMAKLRLVNDDPNFGGPGRDILTACRDDARNEARSAISAALKEMG